MQLVSKISNLCDPDTPTSQTDRQRDGRHAISISRYALVHRAVTKTNASESILLKGCHMKCYATHDTRDWNVHGEEVNVQQHELGDVNVIQEPCYRREDRAMPL